MISEIDGDVGGKCTEVHLRLIKLRFCIPTSASDPDWETFSPAAHWKYASVVIPITISSTIAILKRTGAMLVTEKQRSCADLAPVSAGAEERAESGALGLPPGMLHFIGLCASTRSDWWWGERRRARLRKSTKTGNNLFETNTLFGGGAQRGCSLSFVQGR